jgi:hypothetical protein
MKFYGNGVVWDAENNKRLCKFSKPTEPHGKGVFETEDERIIAELIRRGYASDAAPAPVAPKEPTAPEPEQTKPEGIEPEQSAAEPVTAKLGVKKLREIGKQYGLSFPVGTTMAEMAEQINEAMKK